MKRIVLISENVIIETKEASAIECKQITAYRSERMRNLNFAENREILNGFVVISNKINHLVSILPQLLRIHWLQPTTLPNKKQTNEAN